MFHIRDHFSDSLFPALSTFSLQFQLASEYLLISPHFCVRFIEKVLASSILIHSFLCDVKIDLLLTSVAENVKY